MDILKQCQKWNENNQYQKLIETIENLPVNEHTAEIDSELAKAYIAIADASEKELYIRAIELLKPFEEQMHDDHCWNYRLACAYYYLEEWSLALKYFKNALEARPGDEDTQENINECIGHLSLPIFKKNFRERVKETWEAFAEIEGELRQMMDDDNRELFGEKIIEKCGNALDIALGDSSFEIGFNGEKYELILSPDGLRYRLFPLVYLQKEAPKEILENWNILVGRQPSAGFELRSDDINVSADDVQVWVEKTDDHQVNLTLYCEKLDYLLIENQDKLWWALSMLVDQTIGEGSAIGLIAGFNVCDEPKEEPFVLLSKLPEALQEMGFTLWKDGSDYLENSYIAYEFEPLEDKDADWILDVYIGASRLPILINEYLSDETDTVDEYYQQGIAAGFFIYPVDAIEGEDRGKSILDFRDELVERISKKAGLEAFTFLGGATGLYHGYLDFIAWDLPEVLEVAEEFFEEKNLPYAHFHNFHRDAATVCIWKKEPDVELDPETGSLLSAKDIKTLEDLDDGISGYFGQMVSWLDNFIDEGVEAGRFTYKQAQKDLQIALWYSFAYNNLDEYRFYYRAAEWLKHSEQNAVGCATWYYRYSVALMFCGRLKEALEYAEKGAKEEPTYPWVWLQVGKLRSHFGDKNGALDAVYQGLSLVPGDYEFLTLENEINQGASLEQMEYHFINPDADQTLQNGLDEDCDSKQRSISCINIDDEGLKQFWNIFESKPKQYIANAPAVQFPYAINEHTFDLVFQMNEAGMSKLKFDWLTELKGFLDSGMWLNRAYPDGREAKLDSVIVALDYHMGLLYKLLEEDIYFQIFLNPDGSEKEDAFWSSEGVGKAELYTEEEMVAVEEHIKQHFGKFDNVFHEIVSPDIHVDICVVPPSENRDYYTLVTMGMGAHQMDVPDELSEYKLERAELVIAVPDNWKFDDKSMNDERWYWPIRLLKSLARLPIECDTWLGNGHTIDNVEPFAENTELSGSMLISPQGTDEGSEVCILPDGEEVNFYQVIPLYRNELDYKLEHDADELLEKMTGISFVVNPARHNAITRGTLADDDFNGEMDDAYYHIESIEEKQLPVDIITAYNHMAIYLRWCMEHDLMGDEFLKEYGEVVQKVKNGSADINLREFIRDNLDGCLFSGIFNKQGRLFAGYYYGEGASPYYPADIDDNAYRYFGAEKYHSEEFNDEAYLFIPFDENYYNVMAKVIEERFKNWQDQRFDEGTLKPSDTAKAIIDYLGCECTYFPSMSDDDPITSSYSYATRNRSEKGYIPMLIKPDETLLECFVMNSDPKNDADYYEFNQNTVEKYRKEKFSIDLKDGKEVLEKYIKVRKSEAEDDEFEWQEIIGNLEGGYDNCRFSSYWNSQTHMTHPVILAKIPVKNPWEVFAYLPFGNWNDCPDTEELMEVAKYWFEKHGAIPAAITHDELEFILPAPVSKEDAMELATEQYGFCPDIVDQEEDPTIGNLSDTLWQSKVWYFWWD